MRWEDFRRSDNVEDRTDAPAGGGFPLRGGFKLGGGALVVIVLVSLFLGVDPRQLLGTIEGVGQGVPAPSTPRSQQPAPGYGPQFPAHPSSPAADPAKEFAARVLGETEDVWSAVFRENGTRYQPPTLVLFRGAVDSACGYATRAAGPFYCPGDHRLYLDTSFFDELSRRFQAPGDFAQAYVIAHEVGHHIQTLTGTMARVEQRMRAQGGAQRNALSVRLELQADCYAGVWGHYTAQRHPLDPGDIEEGLRAAAAVGDDRIQKRAQGYAVPESFTHGSAEQRLRWFRRGLDTGDPGACDTFALQRP
jgi:predicted metalloprotease